MTEPDSKAWEPVRRVYDGCSTGPVCPWVDELANGWHRINGYVPGDPGGEEREIILPPEVIAAIRGERSAE